MSRKRERDVQDPVPAARHVRHKPSRHLSLDDVAARAERPALLPRTPPQATLMLGDSSNDAQAAHAAGCPVLLVSYGYNHGEPIRAVSADGYLDSLSELVAAPLAG